jgi:hypothetical protein
MGWNTYVINQTGQDVYCFWTTNPTGNSSGQYPSWDVLNFHVPAGHSCSANRGGTCLFGFGAMFVPYPPPSSSSNPLGTPTGGGGTPDGSDPLGNPTGDLPLDEQVVAFSTGSPLYGIGVPLLWQNFNSSMGDACAHWGFRLVFNASGFQTTVGGGDPWTTTWSYPGPTVAIAESQNWTSGPGMFAAYPASTSGCP